MFLSESDWQAIRKRARSDEMSAAVARLRTEVETFRAEPLTVPSSPGGYYHDYFCPQHGVELAFDASSPTVHRCPIDGATITGERFDAAWRWFVNNKLAEGAYRLAILGQIDDDSHYHVRVAQILLGYSERYASYKQADRTVANPGVATYTTLDESVWVLPLTWAFDIVQDTLSANERSTICSQLFAEVAAHLVTHHFNGIHNFACWHNAAICTIGVLLGREELVDFSINSPFGFDAQLRDGVLGDGLWYEGSFSYHFYSVAALMAQIKATIHRPELDLRGRAEVQSMLVAPILCAYPDGTLPATNDCWYFTGLLDTCCHGVPPAPAFYEVASAWWDEPLFGRVLRRAYYHGPRDSLDALLYGPQTLPAEGVGSLASVHLPNSGYAILRNKDRSVDEQLYLLLKYGPHGGGHGHPDKLNLIIYGQGERLSPDLGTPGYGLALFESWYRQSISHNTVTIDGCSQPEAVGQLNYYDDSGPFQVADASVSWKDPGPYEDVTMRRIILMRPDYFLDVFLVECPQQRRIDWIYRNAGELVVAESGSTGESGPFTPIPSSQMSERGEGYQHLSSTREVISSSDSQMQWQTKEGQLQLRMAGAPQTQIITALVPGNPPTDQHSVVIASRTAARTTFVSLFRIASKSAAPSQVEWQDGDLMEAGQTQLTVLLGGQEERWLIRQSADAGETSQVEELSRLHFSYCFA